MQWHRGGAEECRGAEVQSLRYIGDGAEFQVLMCTISGEQVLRFSRGDCADD